jgi:death-on-curing protein
MKTLTLEQLLELHVLVISQTGGSQGIRDLGRLEAAVATQMQSVFAKAAALIRGIIGDHAFVDGNKRTGMLSGLTFLKINGLKFIAKPGELEDFAVKIATDHLDVDMIAAWLEARCR